VLQETKLASGIDVFVEGYRFICPPPECRHYGLGFAVSRKIVDRIDSYSVISDRVAVLKLQTGNRSSIGIVGVYAPTSTRCAKNNDELDSFYSDLSKAIQQVSGCTLYFVAGDFNAKAGTRQHNEQCIGSHGRGRRNISGETLIQFCEIHKLFLCNTAFQHSARHKTTWTGHRRDQSTGDIVKIYNQIDYILCRHSQKGLLTDSRTYGGCTTSSDHRLLVARLHLPRLFGIVTKKKVLKAEKGRWNVSVLCTVEDKQKYEATLEKKLSESMPPDHTTTPAEDWSRALAVVSETAEEVIGRVQHNGAFASDCNEIRQLSERQKALRLQIANNTNPDRVRELRSERNSLSTQPSFV